MYQIKVSYRLLQDLVETNEYTFRVIAENAAGQSKPSETLGPIIAKDPFDKPGKPGTQTILTYPSIGKFHCIMVAIKK